MIEIRLALMNDQAEALTRVLPEYMAAMMAETALEETSTERVDDLTKSRAILGGFQHSLVVELRKIAKLRAADRAADRARARAAFSQGRTK